MYLGLVATNESAEDPLVGLASAAAVRGWRCRCFLTDSGVKLLHSARLLDLVRSGKLQLDACEHSWQIHGDGVVPDGIVMAGQFQNAELAHECDKVIVL